MFISSTFNRFYHAILNETFTKARQLSFRQWVDTRTGGAFTFYKYEDYSDMDELKQTLKYMNIDYPTDGDKKMSSRKIDNKQLCNHIDWITKILNENGIEFQHDIEAYERAKIMAGIE